MKLLVIDGNSVIHRAYYGVRPLSNHKGIFTHAIFGFMNMYLKEFNAVRPDAVAVAFDVGLQTFRREKVESYKANRQGMPEELAMQMPYIKEILKYMGISCLGAEGFEADDILGTLANICDQQEQECILMTGDKDSLQLITEHVTVHLLTNKETIPYTPEKFRQDYGFAPASLIDLKALMGDSSDNIPGIKGIGEKTAMKLIQQYQSIENLYQNLEQNPETFQATLRIRKLLTEGKESAFQSRWLAQIVQNAPVSLDLKNYFPKKQDSENLRKILTELEMFKLLDRLHLQPLGSSGMPEQAHAGDFQIPELQFAEKFDLDLLRQSGKPVSYVLEDGKLIACTCDNTVMQTQEVSEILAFLESSLAKITDDAKAHYRFALAHHRELKNLVFDAVILGYLLNPSANDYQIPALCAQLGTPCFETELGNYATIQA
ncbi:MAG: DNA polymerase I, partial [Oscillospiraceae bacterium]|nr:DNA polymerase I [Oscillospiraceae bacterium]